MLDDRARTAVTKAIKRAIERVEAAHPAAGRALRSAITTGTICRYDSSISWAVEPSR